jgi:small subunit ribosomal protein S1
VLALSRAHTDRDWKDAEALFQSQDVFEGVVAGHNKGGLIVKIGKVRGFVPASQLVSGRSRTEGGEQGADASREGRWAAMTGQKLQLKVIELDRQRNRLILSERAAMRDWRKTQKEKLLSELKEGDVREGKVISLADFGVGTVVEARQSPARDSQGRPEGAGADHQHRRRAQAHRLEPEATGG